MYLKLPHVNISSLQRTTKPLVENDVVCVMRQYEPAFYTVLPERMNVLLESESKANSAVEKLNSLKKSIKSMHDGGLINWAVMDTLMGKLEDLA